MIIATAGHVDHGKTALVKALTGIDTDTLVEEKKRGLTINIGFAYLPTEEGNSIGFIDVPGHERFIKNALCGLGATDFILLVVAADDGTMPQTEEHLSIIDLLGIDQGAIAVTKIDRVLPGRVAEVECQIGKLVKGSTLENAPVFRVSAPGGDGIDNLREYLIDRASNNMSWQPEPSVDGEARNNFRLAVDRTFDARGVGFIATGTIFSGAIKTNEIVRIAGTEMRPRVRGIRVQNEDANDGHQGQRCALNLSGSNLDKNRIGRGSWITAERAPSPVSRFDAVLRILSHNRQPLIHWAPVHIHLAASNVSARVALLEGKSIRQGSSALIQMVLDKPVGAVFGDRFIIRDQSAGKTIGGGHVIDISPPRRGRAKAERIAWLKGLDFPDAQMALMQLLKLCPEGVNLNQFSANRNLTEGEELAIVDATDMTIIIIGAIRVGISNKNFKQNCAAVIRVLEAWHDSSPSSFGLSEMQLTKAAGSNLSPNIFSGLVNTLLEQSVIVKDGDGIRLARRQIQLSAGDATLWKTVDAQLSAAGLKPVSFTELILEANIDATELSAFLARAIRHGLVIRLSPTLFTKPQSLNRLRELMERIIRRHNGAILTVSAFRDASGIGRNRVIEILEFFDSRRITIRVNNGRRMLPSADKAFAQLLKIQDSHQVANLFST